MTITLLSVMKVLGLIIATPFIALFVLFPINDQPTSGVQKIIFVVIMALLVDILFLHYLHLSIDFSMGK